MMTLAWRRSPTPARPRRRSSTTRSATTSYAWRSPDRQGLRGRVPVEERGSQRPASAHVVHRQVDSKLPEVRSRRSATACCGPTPTESEQTVISYISRSVPEHSARSTGYAASSAGCRTSRPGRARGLTTCSSTTRVGQAQFWNWRTPPGSDTWEYHASDGQRAGCEPRAHHGHDQGPRPTKGQAHDEARLMQEQLNFTITQ